MTSNAAAVADSSSTGTTREVVSFFRPNLTLALVYDTNAYSLDSTPPQIKEALTVDPRTHHYYPILFFNEFWVMKEHLILVNETTPSLNLVRRRRF